MKTSTLFASALVAFSRFSPATAAIAPTKVIPRAAATTSAEQGQQSPSHFPVPGALEAQGCFNADANYTVQNDVEFLSSGSCGTACKDGNFTVMALHGGVCACGSYYPPVDAVVKDSKCNYPCPYYPKEACGSLGEPGFWSVFNTGIDVNVENLPNPKASSSTTQAASKTTATSTSAATSSTAVASAPAATTTDADSGEGDEGEEKKKKGTNTAGIAAGVVVGVVAIAAGIGALFFWMRRKRNAEIEEDHRRNAAVNAFINGSKPPSSHGSISMTDSRLDPVLAHRRMSDGSIADNQDYSRRILRVTNA